MLIFVIGIILILMCLFIDNWKIQLPLFISGFILAFITIMTPLTTAQLKLEYKREIYSLDIYHSINGNFRIGTGQINNIPSYYFYIKDGEDYILENVTGDIRIRLDSDKPYIEKYSSKSTLWTIASNKIPDKYIIHIPKDTIMDHGFNTNVK